jgi:hypothetical protein
MRLGQEDPRWSVVGYDDFFNLSGCRDLIFNAQELNFSLPDIASMLGELDLKFVCIEPRDSEILEKYNARFAKGVAAQSLED